MQRPALIFEYSPLFIVICILLGLLYAYLLYKKSGPWGKSLNRLLFVLRFVLATIIASLLVSPILKQIHNTTERPTMVLALDNSSSIANGIDSLGRQQLLNSLSAIAQQEEDKGFEVEFRTLDGKKHESVPTHTTFDYSSSDLADFLDQVQYDFEGRNLARVVLASDGVYNEGVSPTFKDYNYKITTVGVGDSIPKSDVSITALVYNKISYQGNKFPLVVQFVQQGFASQATRVSIEKDGKLIDSKIVELGKANQLNETQFLIEATDKGFQRYTVTVDPLDGEFTTVNNIKQAYIEVIEGKENIALIAAAPHPDIKAIRSAIESNANYSLDQFIMSFPEDVTKLQQAKKQYDLVIYHHLPNRMPYSNQLTAIEDQNPPKLFIYGGETDLQKFNQLNGVLTMDLVPGEYDKVNASFNQGFLNFKLSEELQQTFTELPPITVPYGKTNIAEGSQVLLYQQVGSIVTNKPLIALNEESDPKTAVILGDGIWKWKLTSYVINENQEVFDELITKLVQFLSSKEDKRKFKTYPIKNEFNISEPVVFDTEVYNDLYERVYGNKIELTLSNKQGKKSNYTFITNENNTRYTISDLTDGVYSYTATTVINNQKASVSGELVVKDIQVEDINLTADFNLLRELSTKTGGQFYHFAELNEMQSDLEKQQAQGIIHSSEQYLPVINLKWLFFLLLIMASVEWFIRKYSGSY